MFSLLPRRERLLRVSSDPIGSWMESGLLLTDHVCGEKRVRGSNFGAGRGLQQRAVFHLTTHHITFRLALICTRSSAAMPIRRVAVAGAPRDIPHFSACHAAPVRRGGHHLAGRLQVLRAAGRAVRRHADWLGSIISAVMSHGQNRSPYCFPLTCTDGFVIRDARAHRTIVFRLTHPKRRRDIAAPC